MLVVDRHRHAERQRREAFPLALRDAAQRRVLDEHRQVAHLQRAEVERSRAFGSIRERIPGSSGPSVAQGVGVEVGETEAAIDLDIVVEYGVPIADLGRSIQRNVKQAVERMTGLRVVEVNVAVDDVYLPAADDDQDTPSRVS